MSFVFLGVVSVVMATEVAASYCRNPKQSDIEPE